MWPHEAGSAATTVSPSGTDLPGSSVAFLRKPASNPQGKLVAAPTDFQVLTRAVRRGDAEAFSRLYDLYSFRLYKLLLVLAHGHEGEAREVCQAVLIKLARRCAVFDDERRLWAWLCVLARNAYVDHWRARQRLNRFVSFEALPAEPQSDSAPEHRLGESLRSALQTLPSDERELLQAAYVDKRPLQELAAEAGQTYKAVESRLGRLRQKLKAQLLRNLRHENES